MLRNMAASLLRHETIRTTLPKAKELRRVVEPLITLAKSDSDAARRRAFAQLRDVEVVEKLFADLGPHYQSRPGGYTRILHMMPRPGDSAPMALMQLVDRPEPVSAESGKDSASQDEAQESGKKSKGKKAAAEADAEAEAAAKAGEEAPRKARKTAAKSAARKKTAKKTPAKKVAKKKGHK